MFISSGQSLKCRYTKLMGEVKDEVKKKRVSYSQYSTWWKCGHKWYLDNIKGLKKFEGSVNTCFGTAIHEVLQKYIETLYTVGHEAADSIKMFDTFKSSFDIELAKAREEGMKYTEDEYVEFCFDAQDILEEFTESSNRLKNFPSKKYEFIGSELPIELDIKHNVQFVAFIDLVLKEKTTGKYKIIDFKTSSTGWNSYMKEDESKYSQLLLYKAFYSKKFNVPLDKIEVEFFILKRKLYEGVAFPQNRLQLFSPVNTKSHIIESINNFSDFVTECFHPTGKYNEDIKYLKNPGKGKKNCKYCIHKKVNCDAKDEVNTD